MTCASCAVPFLPTEEYVAGPDKNPYHAECLALAGVHQGKPVRALTSVPPQPKADPLTPKPSPSGPDRPIPAPEPYNLHRVTYDRFFPIVLDAQRRVQIPLDITEEEADYLYEHLQLYVKRRAKAKP